MVLVLDLYDIIKQVRKKAKIGYRMNMREVHYEHACDMPILTY